ncbi:hypothetical protein ACFLZ7_03800 [Nanoarchaeota archaeon]
MANDGKKKTLNPVKTLSLIFVLILIVNMTAFAFHKITTFTFWIIIGLAALVAYIGLPKLRKD